MVKVMLRTQHARISVPETAYPIVMAVIPDQKPIFAVRLRHQPAVPFRYVRAFQKVDGLYEEEEYSLWFCNGPWVVYDGNGTLYCGAICYTAKDLNDPAYPRRLAACADAPLLLYCKGEADLNSSRALAVVGTRKATWTGRESCRRIVGRLADLNEKPLIVSGMARGIDAAAHTRSFRSKTEKLLPF